MNRTQVIRIDYGSSFTWTLIVLFVFERRMNSAVFFEGRAIEKEVNYQFSVFSKLEVEEIEKIK